MDLSDKELRRGFIVLALTAFAVSLSMGVQQSISPSFFRETIGMDGAQNGYLVAFRELPGFLLAFVAALLLRLGMARATGLALLIMGIGYASFSVGYSFAAIVIASVIGSIGFHSWLQMQYALGLSIAKEGEEGSVLGRISSIGFSGRMLGMVAVLIVLQVVGYLAGAKDEWQGVVFRTLFIVGGVSAVAITTLLICAALINWRTAPWIGRLIDRHGEKRMLTINYCGHFVVFLGFALAQNVWLLYAFYLGYN
ncbi:MAG TPA: hypothetical protein VEX37_04565, partial [Thermomicrobiales bacterium]|nr:hypothetical protein [Thermomicrobiales bacterium]